jgi:hypothetical protein
MTAGNGEQRNEQAPWWGIGVLYLMLVPFAVLAYFAFKALSLVWNNFDGTVGARYAVLVFAVGGILIAVYIVMIVRQIYKEFVVPNLASRYSTTRPRDDRK